MRTKYYVKDHSSNCILGSNLTQRAAIALMRACSNKASTRMYPMAAYTVKDTLIGESVTYSDYADARMDAERRCIRHREGYEYKHATVPARNAVIIEKGDCLIVKEAR